MVVEVKVVCIGLVVRLFEMLSLLCVCVLSVLCVINCVVMLDVSVLFRLCLMQIVFSLVCFCLGFLVSFVFLWVRLVFLVLVCEFMEMYFFVVMDIVLVIRLVMFVMRMVWVLVLVVVIFRIRLVVEMILLLVLSMVVCSQLVWWVWCFLLCFMMECVLFFVV